MSEVYRARDSKLDRDVAIKVLPESFAADPERVARFEREAKTLASLNHPNIGQIYDLEEFRSGGSSGVGKGSRSTSESKKRHEALKAGLATETQSHGEKLSAKIKRSARRARRA